MCEDIVERYNTKGKGENMPLTMSDRHLRGSVTILSKCVCILTVARCEGFAG